MKNILRNLADENKLLDIQEVYTRFANNNQVNAYVLQLILLLNHLSENDLNILKSDDVLKKNNIAWRCVKNTGLNAEVTLKCLQEILFALRCTDRLETCEWFCGVSINENSSQFLTPIESYSSVLHALNFAKNTSDRKQAMEIYAPLAKAGIPQAEYEVAKELISTSNSEINGMEKFTEYMQNAALKGYEPACLYLADVETKKANFSKASFWYNHTFGTGLNINHANNIQFLNYQSKVHKIISLVLLLANIIGILSFIIAVQNSDSMFLLKLVAVILEIVSMVTFLASFKNRLSKSHSSPILYIVIEFAVWFLSMILIL